MTRARRWFIAVMALILVAALLAYWGSRPQRVAGLVMSQLGPALGLEITATGVSEYALRGGPRLVLRNVVARTPGATRDVLRANRIDVAVPWSTVRSRGAELAFTHVELDAPVIDLGALQSWLAARPAGESRMPTLSNGLRVRDGRVVGDGWSVEALSLDVPRVLPKQPVDARISGQVAVPPSRHSRVGGNPELQVAFALTFATTAPANNATATVNGTVRYVQADRRLVSRIHASGPLHLDDGELTIAPLRFSTSARYTQGKTNLPFAFALNGPLRMQGTTFALSPAGVALRGSDVIPNIDARAAFAYSKRAALHLEGTLATWPDTWPALPAPIGQSTSHLPFALDYNGPPDFSHTTRLQLTRDDTHFDGRFRVPDVLAWIDAPPASPLPPLSGRVRTPRVEIAGAILEGVDVRLEDPALNAAP